MINKLKLIGYCSVVLLISSCYKQTFVASGTGLEDWSFNTHSGLATANYATVFAQEKVNRLDFVIEDADWNIMQNNLEDIVGESANMGGGPPNGGPGGGQGGGGAGAANSFSEATPQYVKTQMFFNGKQWYDVGIRYKGNSSLTSNNGKLPLRLKMNQFETDNLAITNQKFYGFQELSLSSNYNDKSFLREKVTCDLFREAGIKAPQTAFYEVYLDHGNGPVYFGLYTAVEVIADNMVKTQFGSDLGNIYKPDGDAASFANGSFNTTDLEKKNNTESDWSDVEALYNILNASTRTSNPDLWKNNLEAVLDVNQFLKWLAVNTTLQNWDTYGNMTHNYYLYNNPANNKLTWIPWDNNEALEEGKQGGALPFDFSTTTNGRWPLIEYLYAEQEYKDIYNQHIYDFIYGVFTPTDVQSRYENWKSIIEASVVKEETGYTYLNSVSEFETAIETLKNHVTARVSAAQAYL